MVGDHSHYNSEHDTAGDHCHCNSGRDTAGDHCHYSSVSDTTHNACGVGWLHIMTHIPSLPLDTRVRTHIYTHLAPHHINVSHYVYYGSSHMILVLMTLHDATPFCPQGSFQY